MCLSVTVNQQRLQGKTDVIVYLALSRQHFFRLTVAYRNDGTVPERTACKEIIQYVFERLSFCAVFSDKHYTALAEAGRFAKTVVQISYRKRYRYAFALDDFLTACLRSRFAAGAGRFRSNYFRRKLVHVFFTVKIDANAKYDGAVIQLYRNKTQPQYRIYGKHTQ